MPDKFAAISKKLDDLEGDMIEFQKAITAIPALSPVNGGDGEWDKAMYIKKFLADQGLTDVMQIDAPDKRARQGKRPNLIARLPGKWAGKTIWLMAHMDVVPAGDLKLWKSDPWTVVEKDGRLYGRGTEDNQQGLTGCIFTLLAFHQAGIQPAYNLAVILAADEETGSEYGLGYLMEKHRRLFNSSDIIIVPDAGEPDGSMIEVAEKSIVWYKFTTRGEQCHASLPDQGVNAFRAGSNLVVRLDELYREFAGKDPVFVPPISTFEPTRKEANVPNVNTIPGEDVFHLDCRLLPEYPVADLHAAVRRICREVEKEFSVKIEVETSQVAEAAPPTDADAEVVKKLQTAIGDVYRVKARPMGIGGGTVAAIFRRAGLPAAVWSTLEDVCHQPNEYCLVSNMVRDAKVFAHVCLQD